MEGLIGQKPPQNYLGFDKQLVLEHLRAIAASRNANSLEGKSKQDSLNTTIEI
jgi:hypothetical protein